MILVTHAIIGTALTQKLHNYLGIFLLALTSHYILDMIPHWHYRVPWTTKAVNHLRDGKTLSFETHFLPEFFKISLDALIGTLLSFYFFGAQLIPTLTAVFGAILPDLLVGLYRFYPAKILRWHHLFHYRVHAKLRLDGRPIIGIGMQILLAAISVYMLNA